MQVHTIDLEFQGVENGIAVFLVEGPDGLVLIETGPESTRERSLEGIRAAGFSPDDIEAVLVTHIHLDHAGAVGWWAQQGKTVYVHEKGAKHLIDPSRLEESARMVYQEEFDQLWGALPPAPEEHVHVLSDEQTVSVAGLGVTALDTPGHAFHHLCFQIDGIIFTGDAAGARLPGSDYISVTSAPPQFHLEEGLKTLARLEALQPKSLFLTHFGEVEDPAAHIADYRRAWELNAQFIKDRLEEGMDEDSLRIAYQAFQMEQAFRENLPTEMWKSFQTINHTDMCADGIRLYWERKAKESTT